MDQYVQSFFKHHDILWRRVEDLPQYSATQFLQNINIHSIEPNPNFKFSFWKVLRTLATKPNLILSIFEEVDQRKGKYTVRLFDNMRPVSITVDSNIPLIKSQSMGFENLMTVAPTQDYWPLILEKAVAKLLGGYDIVQSKQLFLAHHLELDEEQIYKIMVNPRWKEVAINELPSLEQLIKTVSNNINNSKIILFF